MKTVSSSVLWATLEQTVRYFKILNLFPSSRGNKTWSTPVVSGSCLWVGGAQSSGAAWWRWWLLLHYLYIPIKKWFVQLLFKVGFQALWVIVLTLYVFACFYTQSDDFPESTGVKRIVQALNANVWTSVEMKDGERKPQMHFQKSTWCVFVWFMTPCIWVQQRTIRALVWWAAW